MIIRSFGHGQCELSEMHAGALEMLDRRLLNALNTDDRAGYAQALTELHDLLDHNATPTPDDYLGTSDVIVPERGTNFAEAVALMLHGNIVQFST